MSLTTGSGYGAEFAIQYMDKMAKIFGFEVASAMYLNVRPGKQKEKAVQNNKTHVIEGFRVFISRIEKGERTKPTLNSLVPFGIFKKISELAKDAMPADYDYYKDKKDFYCDVDIPVIKKWIANKVVKKEVDKILKKGNHGK